MFPAIVLRDRMRWDVHTPDVYGGRLLIMSKRLSWTWASMRDALSSWCDRSSVSMSLCVCVCVCEERQRHREAYALLAAQKCSRHFPWFSSPSPPHLCWRVPRPNLCFAVCTAWHVSLCTTLASLFSENWYFIFSRLSYYDCLFSFLLCTLVITRFWWSRIL